MYSHTVDTDLRRYDGFRWLVVIRLRCRYVETLVAAGFYYFVLYKIIAPYFKFINIKNNSFTTHYPLTLITKKIPKRGFFIL